MREPFDHVDRLEMPTDLWPEVRRRAADAPPGPRSTVHHGSTVVRRGAVILLAFAVFSAAAALAWQALRPRDTHRAPATAVPRPDSVQALADVPAGWSRLPPPPEVRSGASVAWTGDRLLIWGGYVFEGSGDKPPEDTGFVFDALDRSWSEIPASPLTPRSVAASAWTGSEFLIWGGWDGTDDGTSPGVLADGAAYDPASGSWRVLPPAPITARAPLSVWTGHELIVWGSALRASELPRDGAAYDPAANTWRPIPAAPIELSDATAVWTGREMIVFGAALFGGNDPTTSVAVGAAYDPATDTWRRIADSELSPQASTAAWNGEAMIAWDYLNASAAYDPATDAWRRLPDVPLDTAECSPQSVAVGGTVFGDYCGLTTVFDPTTGTWLGLARGGPEIGWNLEPASADHAVLIPARHLDGSTRMYAFRPTTRGQNDAANAGPNADLEVAAQGRVGGWVVLGSGAGVSVAGGGELFFVDPATASGRRVAIGGWDYDDVRLAGGAEGAILLVSGRTLWTVEPRSGAILGRLEPPSLGRLGSALQVGPETWVTASSSGTEDVLARIDLDTGAVLDRYDIGRSGHDLVGTAGFLFTGSLGPDGAAILRIDPPSGRVATVPIPTLGSIAASRGRVWFTTTGSAACLDAVELVPCGDVSIERPASLAVDDDHLWVLSHTGSRSSRLFVPDPKQPATVTLVDLRSGRVLARPLALPDVTPASIAAFGGSAWVGFHGTGRILRIDA